MCSKQSRNIAETNGTSRTHERSFSATFSSISFSRVSVNWTSKLVAHAFRVPITRAVNHSNIKV